MRPLHLFMKLQTDRAVHHSKASQHRIDARAKSQVPACSIIERELGFPSVLSAWQIANAVLLSLSRSIGDQEVIYQPLVVGGGDELGTYRADSFICSAAVHRGLFTVSWSMLKSRNNAYC